MNFKLQNKEYGMKLKMEKVKNKIENSNGSDIQGRYQYN